MQRSLPSWPGAISRPLAAGLATTWSFGNGELQLLHEPEMGAAATCLTLTAGGNFVLVGYRSDHADRCLTP